jgi:hypothetical protein
MEAELFIQHAIGASRRVLREVAEQRKLEAELRLELTRGRKRVDTDAQDLGIGPPERLDVRLEGGQFVRSASREGQRVEGEDQVLARERRQGHRLPILVEERERRGRATNFGWHADILRHLLYADGAC